MEHFRILLDQHRSIRSLMDSVQKPLGTQERIQLVKQLRDEIDLHTSLEEKNVYPVLETFLPLKREVFSFWREHERLRHELQSLSSSTQDERQFHHCLNQVSLILEEHLREEENQVFPEACKMIPKDQLEKIDIQLARSLQQSKKVA